MYTCVYKTGCTARKMTFFKISQDRQRQILAADAMATTINNNRLKCTISVIIVTGKVFHCFCLKLSFGQYNNKTLLRESQIITTKNKGSPIWGYGTFLPIAMFLEIH